MDQIAMVLLTGGNSSRMGTPKSELIWEDKTFAERIADEMAQCGPVYLSVSADTVPPRAAGRFPCIIDEADHVGPLGGISAVFHRTDADAIFVGACDMPFMTAAYIDRLCEIWNIPSDGTRDALLVRDEGGRIYTTAGIYHRRLLPDIDQAIADGNFRLRDLLRTHPVSYLPKENLGDLKKALTNINTAQDLETALADSRNGGTI